MAENSPWMPRKAFFVRGNGKHSEKLTSFEMALRDAGIEKFNLVRVSSIYPPGCKVVSREEGLKDLSPGQLVFCVMSDNSSNEPNRLIAAAIGAAIPLDGSVYGYLSEHHSYGQTEKEAGDYAEDLAAAMLASTLGIEFDEDKSWDETKEVWKISGKIYRSFNITQSAIVRGGYTTVIAAAVFVI